jgi:RNA polymerase sigma-70 factor (ECF subfamily)
MPRFAGLRERPPELPQEPLPSAVVSAAFERVYREHHAFVWKSVRRLGVPDAEVDDVVQDVFMIVHRRLADFEGRSKITTWLFAIAYRVVKDHRRSRLGAVRREAAVAPPRAPTEPDRKYARNQAAKALDEILGELDEDKRTVLVMADVVHMTVPEISEVLEVPLNTVYSRLRVARKRFEDALDARVRSESGGMPWTS